MSNEQIWVTHYTTSNGEEIHDILIASSEEEAHETYQMRFLEEFKDCLDEDTPDMPVCDVFPIYSGLLQNGEGKSFTYTLKEVPVCNYHTDSPGWDACNDDHVGPCKFKGSYADRALSPLLDS